MFKRKVFIGTILSFLLPLTIAFAEPQEETDVSQTTVLSYEEQNTGNINIQTSNNLEENTNLLERATTLINEGKCEENATSNIDAFANCMETAGINEDTVMEWGNLNRDLLEVMDKYPYLMASNMTNEEAASLLDKINNGVEMAGFFTAASVGVEEINAFLESIPLEAIESYEEIQMANQLGREASRFLELAKYYETKPQLFSRLIEESLYYSFPPEETLVNMINEYGNEIREIVAERARVGLPTDTPKIQQAMQAAEEATELIQKAQSTTQGSGRLVSGYDLERAASKLMWESKAQRQEVIKVASDAAKEAFSDAKEIYAENRDKVQTAEQGAGIWATAKVAASQAIDFLASPAVLTVGAIAACAGAAAIRFTETKEEYDDDRKRFMENRMQEIEQNDGID